MYFVERNNKLATHVNMQVQKTNKAKPPVVFREKLSELSNSFS